MSQHQTSVSPITADPPRLDPQENTTQHSEAARGLQQSGLASRPLPPSLILPTSDQGSLNTASDSKLEPSSVLLGEDAVSSSQRLGRGDTVGGDQKQDLSPSTTPLAHFSRDTDAVIEGHVNQTVQLQTGSFTTPLAPSKSASSQPEETAPSTSSYIPFSQPRLQAPIPKPTHTDEATLISRGGNMFRLTTPAQRRRNMANTNALSNYEADLTSRDRAKQKEAVRRFLDEKVEDGWTYQWPRPSDAQDGFTDQLKDTGREATQWKERDEWLSNTNDTDDEPTMPTAASPDTVSPAGSFKFESPDDVGESIKRRELERKRRRERKLQDELAYNEGLQCFNRRRDAWTGARRVPRNSDVTRSPSKTLSSVIADIDMTAPATDDSDSSDPDLAIEIPVAPPLIPPTNGMRANITPAAYNTIYDKVVLQQVSPSCPVNLQDIISACVQGWKRDGEWPPRSTVVEEPKTTAATKRKGRKLSVAGIFGLSRIAKEIAEDEKEKEKAAEGEGGLRRGLQKMLGLRKESVGVNGNGHANGHGPTHDKGTCMNVV